MKLLTMSDIYKSFDNNEVLKNVSLEIEISEVHALLGGNGAGKSTLMNILSGVIEKDAGSIQNIGQIYSAKKWRAYRKRIYKGYQSGCDNQAYGREKPLRGEPL